MYLSAQSKLLHWLEDKRYSELCGNSIPVNALVSLWQFDADVGLSCNLFQRVPVLLIPKEEVTLSYADIVWRSTKQLVPRNGLVVSRDTTTLPNVHVACKCINSPYVIRVLRGVPTYDNRSVVVTISKGPSLITVPITALPPTIRRVLESI